MPELPEVQTIVNGLKKSVQNQILKSVDILNKKTLNHVDAEKILNSKLKELKRIGKYIIFHFDKFDLVVHLRMTGQFFYFSVPKEFVSTKSDRVIFHFNHGILVFRDVRKFGTMKIAEHAVDVMPPLGVDPIGPEFTKEHLKQLLSNSSSNIKAFLLKQDKIAGLGNIYADEALFLSKIHPESKSSQVPKAKIDKLQESIVFVLEKALKSEGTSLGRGLGNYRHVNGEGKNQQELFVYGQHKKNCPCCNRPLKKKVVASRGTTFCIHCQKKY